MSENTWHIGRTDLQNFTSEGVQIHYLYTPSGERFAILGGHRKAQKLLDEIKSHEAKLAFSA